MSYFLDNLTTGKMREIADFKEAFAAFKQCPHECELSNEDGEIIADKMQIDDDEYTLQPTFLETVTQWDEVDHEPAELAA